MLPREHALSQHVLEFLIEHQDSFLVGMQLVSVASFSLTIETETQKASTALPPATRQGRCPPHGPVRL
jgi:hypothetical protein